MLLIYQFCDKYICGFNISKIYAADYEDNPCFRFQNLNKVNVGSDISDISDLESVDTVDNNIIAVRNYLKDI
mgnify:CR=1 FL=1